MSQDIEYHRNEMFEMMLSLKYGHSLTFRSRLDTVIQLWSVLCAYPKQYSMTKVFEPNLNEAGEIDLQRNYWTPVSREVASETEAWTQALNDETKIIERVVSRFK